ncbi:heterocyst frequency control protein PatD [Leptolyngbya cf. ectocarpi LEGE 11479]|uniref:Heterocyst frequency control protein PatD n=1 Tax=Leptolyngbya cf. ectocarpi LEGE 11479 TaxID=1828722 RepID=A0A928ZRL7_LEPEC|nr:heterocyst frequency control protein PatD [Leptolyngbya ectocarpi]MBE9066733.1 heterocyst frequency control protein PatD [Leptolyngbya cf. ectocarpi LEGE 11479]
MTFFSPIDELECYGEYLSQLRAAVGQDEDQREGQAEMAQRAHALQAFYQQTLWGLLTQTELSQPQWRSATTEIHRHMRLLGVEVSFARSARQGPLRQQRLEQIEQRLEQLQGFTNVLIALVKPLAASPRASDVQL